MRNAQDVSLITLAQDSSLEYLDATSHNRGEFYVGVDFGKHEDYSVVSKLERLWGRLYLRHCHQFLLAREKIQNFLKEDNEVLTVYGYW